MALKTAVINGGKRKSSKPCAGHSDKGKMKPAQREAIAKGMKGKSKSTSQKAAISEGMKKSPCGNKSKTWDKTKKSVAKK